MIQVNLLPPEYRSKDRAPVSRLLALVAGVLITFSALGVYVYTRVILVEGMKVKKADRQEEEKLKAARAKQYDDLKREVDAREAREKKIDEIATNDPRYAPMMWHLSDMLWKAQEDTTAPFLGWYSNMSVSLQRATGRSRAKGEVPELRIGCSTATDDAAKVSAFYRAFRKHPFMGVIFDMDGINPIKTDRAEHAKFDPPAAMNFEVKVQSFAPEERVQREQAAAKAAAAAAGGDQGGDGKPGDGKAPGKAPGKSPGKAPGKGQKG